MDLLGAPVVVLRTRSTQPRSAMRSSITAMFGGEMSSACAELLLVHVAVVRDQHQDRELGDLQAERLHVLREHLAQLERRARRGVADQVGQARVVELPGFGAARASAALAVTGESRVTVSFVFLRAAPR